MIFKLFIYGHTQLMAEKATITTVANTVASTSEAAELVAYQDVIPKVKPETIYKIGTFDFTSRKIIKTFEHSFTEWSNSATLNTGFSTFSEKIYICPHRTCLDTF